MLSANQAACWIYGLKCNEENGRLSLQKLRDAELIPVLIVRGDPTCPVAVSQTKYDMEPWRFVLLAGNTPQLQPDDATTTTIAPPPQPNDATADTSAPPQSGDTTTSISNTTSPLSSVIVPTATNPSSAAIIDLVKGIFLTEPVEGITDDQFLDEQHVFDVVAAYLPDGAASTSKLAEWMAKDGTWGSTKRKRSAQGRISGRLYHVVQEAYRDYTWDDLSNVHQFRRHIRMTSDKIFNIGYIRRSNTHDTTFTKMRSMDLQAIKLKRKLLCEKVYGSFNTSAASDIQSRDHADNRKWLKDLPRCAGNTQDLYQAISDSHRKVRLIMIDFAGLCTNIDYLRHFIQTNKTIVEIVVDLGHKVDVFSRRQILTNDGILTKFNCRKACTKRSQ